MDFENGHLNGAAGGEYGHMNGDGKPMMNGHGRESSSSPGGSPRSENGAIRGGGGGGAAADAVLMKKPTAILDDKMRKKNARKLSRSNSKDGVLGVAGTPNFVAPHRKWKNSRRSRNGYGRGLPKKGGAGGKGVWGKLGSEIYDEMEEEDQNDPNFDLDAYNSRHNIELKEVIPAMTDAEFTKKVEPIILEYYEHGDTHEVAESLDDVLTPERRPLITKIAVEMAFEHKQSQREMTSVLLSDLYGRSISGKDICKGFDMLLANMADLILDTPEAPTMLGNFIARAVADDCIPPKYAHDLSRFDEPPPPLSAEEDGGAADGLPTQQGPLTQGARDALARAHTLLSMQPGFGHLDDVWGVGGAFRPVQSITRQMAMLLQEYLLSRDLEEAQRSIRELEVPHFHHELIYEAIVLTLEALNESTEEAVCKLFKTLDDTCIVSPEQMEQAFRRVYDDMTDIVLDIPLAYSILDRFVQRCQRAGFLSDAVIKDLPSRGRKRFVSEGDGGLIKQVNLHSRVF